HTLAEAFDGLTTALLPLPETSAPTATQCVAIGHEIAFREDTPATLPEGRWEADTDADASTTIDDIVANTTARVIVDRTEPRDMTPSSWACGSGIAGHRRADPMPQSRQSSSTWRPARTDASVDPVEPR